MKLSESVEPCFYKALQALILWESVLHIPAEQKAFRAIARQRGIGDPEVKIICFFDSRDSHGLEFACFQKGRAVV